MVEWNIYHKRNPQILKENYLRYSKKLTVSYFGLTHIWLHYIMKMCIKTTVMFWGIFLLFWTMDGFNMFLKLHAFIKIDLTIWTWIKLLYFVDMLWKFFLVHESISGFPQCSGGVLGFTSVLSLSIMTYQKNKVNNSKLSMKLPNIHSRFG